MTIEAVPVIETAAIRVRRRIVEMCAQPGGGHLGGAMSLVEILLTLYQDVMRVDAARPAAVDRDILVLSKGHRITPAVLERLKSYSRSAAIREPIRVWVPVDRGRQFA